MTEESRGGGLPAPESRGACEGLGQVALERVSQQLFDLGAPPKASDSASQVASILIHSHARILGGMYLAGIAIRLGICFFATVRAWLKRVSADGDTPLADVAWAAGLFAIGLGVLGMLLFYGAAYKVAGEGGLSAVQALTDAGNASIELTKFPLALFVAAVSLTVHRNRLLPRWLIRAGELCVPLLFLSAIPLFAHGSFTQFGGGLDVIGAAPAILWIFVLSLVMVRACAPGPTPPN